MRALAALIMFASMLLPYAPAFAPVASADEPAIVFEGQTKLPKLPGKADLEVLPQQVTTSTVTLRVVSARTEPLAFSGAGVLQGDPITTYNFIINVDDTGDPTQPRVPDCSPADPDYPANCTWPSIRAAPGYAPIVTQGDQTILNETTGLTLPDGKYLISVMAEGYKIDGVHFTVPLEEPGLLEVQMQPHPLPTGTIRVKVFEDISPTNGQPDVPIEGGLAGFKAIVNDMLGQVTNDVFGNPICTEYVRGVDGSILLDADLMPTPIPGTGGECISDINGDIVIPNLGPNRYDVAVVPPDGTDWVQTTTLEGGKDWDTWLMEAYTGLDTEFVVAGEPFPFTIVGFVHPQDMPASAATGEIRGRVVSVAVFTPFQGGLPYIGGQWGGLSGAKITHPISDAWIALSDLQAGDTAIYVGKANPDGSFVIPSVPDGNYFLGYWDEAQNHIFDWVQVTVSNGEVADLGNIFLTGWFTRVEGHVFLDENENGKMDPGEMGVPDYLVVLRRRENSLMDRFSVAMMTDAMGMYMFEQAYPLTKWLVLEAYNERYYTTGVTYQAENQPEETTVLGDGVDVGFLPIIGQSGRLDWGVKPYAPGTNGGIVGSVTYDTTRNELDPRYLAAEDWQPGIPGLTINLYATVKNPDGSFVMDVDGSYMKGPLLNTTVTEAWERPTDCQARDVDGNPIDQDVLPPATGGYDCLEGPLMGLQFQTGFAALDGNWGFTTITADPVTGAPIPEQPIPPGDYLVEIEIPNDAWGRPLYKVVKEEDINVFGGDQYVPQVPPHACAGALHTVDVAGIGPDGPDAVYNPSFAAEGGSPYEGMQRPLCDVKLATVSSGRSTAPMFYLFTDVPIPGKYFGYIVDDLNLSVNPQDLLFGEKAGFPNAAIGIYDYTNRLITTIQSDPNGLFEVLLPSTTTINCPSPTGVCANVYRLVGNDPGIPGRLNPNYDPQFRTISAMFEVFPGTTIPADLAPTQVGVSIQGPGSQFTQAVSCALADTTPQLFTVSQPWVDRSGQFTIVGKGFGATQGSGLVTFDGALALPVVSWSDTQIVVDVPFGTTPGPHQLSITADNGESTVNGLTFHVLGPQYKPDVYEVGPGKPYATIQSAIDAAASKPNRDSLVVVYPGIPDLTNPRYNPRGAYYENIIIYSPIKLQGVGPGGFLPDSTYVPGSIIDGGAYGGDTQLANDWRVKLAGLTWDGNQNFTEGQTIYLIAHNGDFTTNYKASIDGFDIRGGDQQGFPNNINQIGGTPTGLPAEVVFQGGAIFANSYVRHLQITNNVVQNNGGAYGTIRIGTPHLPGALNDNQNDGLVLAHNRVIANGGTNLAGAIGIFSGANGYEIAYNDICGNFSAEYGGGISHYGYSPNGKIHHNRIYFNRSYDEGGGIMIAGELPADPTILTPGAGPVDVYSNVIQANLANDDGGGLRFLMAGNFPYNVYNNMIVNNVSTHEGGGISLNDAPNVRVYNNTIMKNITTATAMTSNGQPAPAGLSSSRNSSLLQATLPGGSPIFSKPLLFNNIFWDNRAGMWTGGGVAGIGIPEDPNPIYYWDLGVADGSGVLDPTNTLLQVDNLPYIVPSASNQVGADPLVVLPYDTSVNVMPWRTNPNFVGAILVAVEQPPNLMGDYHITSGSPAEDAGAASKSGISAPLFDFDDEPRPFGPAFDVGADELSGAVSIFPLPPIIDNFNRADGAVNSMWAGNVDPVTGAFRILGNQVQVFNSGFMYWNVPAGGNVFGAGFGPDQEAYFTLNKVNATSTEHGLFLKFNGPSPASAKASLIEVLYDAVAGSVRVRTLAPTQGWVARAAFAATLAPGDVLGARATSDGTVSAFKNGMLVGSTNVRTGVTPWPDAFVTAGGKVGVWFTAPSFTPPNDALFDDFGGGDVVFP